MKFLSRYLLLGCLLLANLAWSSETTLRVAFVYNFIKFIEWPTAKVQQSMRLCALGVDTEVRQALTQIKGKSANKQVIELVYLDSEEDLVKSLSSCQMIYRPLRSSLYVLPHPLPQGVLLVADEDKHRDLNAGISLVRNNEGRIEFNIYRPAIEQAGVVVSSQLLKLAKNSTEGL